MSKFLLCCDCPRERYTPVLIGDAGWLGCISGVLTIPGQHSLRTLGVQHPSHPWMVVQGDLTFPWTEHGDAVCMPGPVLSGCQALVPVLLWLGFGSKRRQLMGRQAGTESRKGILTGLVARVALVQG